METLLEHEFSGSEQINSLLKTAKGEVEISPLKSAKFCGKINLVKLSNIGIFTIKSDPFKVHDTERDYFGLTLPMTSPFVVKEDIRQHAFDFHRAHFLHPDKPFDFATKTSSTIDIMVANFFTDHLTELYESLFVKEASTHLLDRIDLPLTNSHGYALREKLKQLILLLKSSTYLPNAPLSTVYLKEKEDELMFHFLSILHDDIPPPRKTQHDKKRVDIVCEYMIANLDKVIHRSELSSISGLSIRTLSRYFNKYFGMGPMAFLKKRRLEQVHTELMLGDKSSLKISDIAMKYGFQELGKFSSIYKAQYGELPSKTLAIR